MPDDIGEREAQIYAQMIALVKWGVLAVLVAAGVMETGVLGF